MVVLKGRRRLGHLHQGNDPFLHPGAAGAGKKHHWKLFPGGPFHSPGDLLTHIVAHAAHQEPGITDADHRQIAADLSAAGDDGLVEPGLFPGCLQLFFISREV